jgi:hypothetical protein
VKRQASALHATLLVLLSPTLLLAQGPKTTGTVAPNLVEFKIPLEQAAGTTWNWNRAETQDNDCEYMWRVAIKKGSEGYSFGFYLYKFPGSKPARGELQDLLSAGQASVFREDAAGHGDLIENGRVKVSTEDGRIVLRITDAALIRTIFGSRPEAVTINTRAIGSNFEIVKIEYRD